MKIYRSIASNLDNNQVDILRKYNIKANEGMCRFNIYDIDLYCRLIPLLDQWNVNLDTLGVDFSAREVLSADYCVINSWNTYGYPMPDNDFGYLDTTFDTKEMCQECGIGNVQNNNFRVKKVPKYSIWGLGWVFDELFIRTYLYEKIFKPLGIKSRPLFKYKTDCLIDSYVQLIIPVIKEPLNLFEYESTICSKCGSIKFDSKIRGYYPLQEHPLPYIYKSQESFGGGFNAHKKIFVSAFLRDIMIDNKVFRTNDFIPCVKSDELSEKNHEITLWEKRKR